MSPPKLSDNALVVLKKRGYLLKKRSTTSNTGTTSWESSDEMFRRVAKLIAGADARYLHTADSVRHTEEEFYRMMSNLEYLSGSVLLNAARSRKQFSACYVLPLTDSLEDIYDQLRNAALIARTGGGIGIPLTNLRPRGSHVISTGGISSGAVSFLRLFNYSATTISEASVRRPAMMGVLKVDHPDIVEFIMAKEDPSALYHFNISVGATNEFMDRVKRGRGHIHLFHPNDGETERDMDVMELWNLIATQAWKVGDPGLVFLDQMNKDCPTPQLGTYETTNPCFVGSTRVATPYGLLRMDDLSVIGRAVPVAVDDRSVLTADGLPDGIDGVEMLPASAVTKTGFGVPVLTVTTKGGFSVTATADHRFLTPNRYAELRDLKPGYQVLIQSAEGSFNADTRLPNRWDMEELQAVLVHDVNDQHILTAQRTRASGSIPREWTKEIGEVLGWVVGDGWLTTGEQRLGVVFGYGAQEASAVIGSRLQHWFGGCEVRRDRVIQLTFSSTAYRFFSTLGLQPVRAGLKRVPESVWSAPRDAVIGFLRGLFGADGTLQWDRSKQYCSVRLASNSKHLLQDVQLLLVNLGILGRIFLRRNAQWRMMPDSLGQPKKYWTRSQYELIIGAQHRDRFIRRIGFADPVKQTKGEAFLASMRKGTYDKPFVDEVDSVVDAGQADVYDLSQPKTKSFIANGFVVHNCGEQPLLPYESCNLGHVNLGKFVKESRGARHEARGDKLHASRPSVMSSGSNDFTLHAHTIDWFRLEEVIRLGVHFQDNVIDLCDYPIEKLREMAYTTRKIGVGAMGWADMLVKLGIRYDSNEALKLAEKVSKFIQEIARDESVNLAKRRGSFPAFEESTWKKRGFSYMRNSTVNTIAPTGTISMIAGCSSGIESLFALVYRKENILDLGKTSLLEVNKDFQEMLKRITELQKDGPSSIERTVLQKISETGSCQDIKELPRSIKDTFRVSMEIPYEWHIKMQAAWQKYTDSAVSKTINLPNSATVEDIKKAYLLAYETGCKGITVYRDGCRKEQVLNIGGSIRGTRSTKSTTGEDECLECHGEVIADGGCITCTKCGWSKCSV